MYESLNRAELFVFLPLLLIEDAIKQHHFRNCLVSSYTINTSTFRAYYF